MLSFRFGCSWVTRAGLTGALLWVPASMATVVSCGLSCGGHCEYRTVGMACYALPASTCLDGGADYACAVRTGCHCAGMSPTNLQPAGCNLGSCDQHKDQSTCLQTTGCEWSDACQDAIDCHSITNENTCNAQTEQCGWQKECATLG